MCLKIVYVDQRAIYVVVFVPLTPVYSLMPRRDMMPINLTHCLCRGILTKRQLRRWHVLRHADETSRGQEKRLDTSTAKI